MPLATPLPLTVIGGYLGAGKTTVVNHLLRAAHGLRIAVLVNDFGAINIDAELIVNRSGDTIQLANGCICCTLVDGLVVALDRLRRDSADLEHVVIEASGVADPRRIAAHAALPGYRLGAVIVVADADAVQAKSRDRYVGDTVLEQLRGADLILLSKTDLVDAGRRGEVQHWLRAIAPECRVVEASFGEVSPAVLLDAEPGPPAAARSARLETSGGEAPVSNETQILTRERPIRAADLAAAIAALPQGVWRGKGFVDLLESPECRSVFQMVGRRWSVEPGAPWGEEPRRTRLVFIGAPGSVDLAAFAALVDGGGGCEA